MADVSTQAMIVRDVARYLNVNEKTVYRSWPGVVDCQASRQSAHEGSNPRTLTNGSTCKKRLTHDDLDTAVYDSEDKVLITLSTIDKTVDQDVEYTATVHVSFEVERAEIETERNFGFAVRACTEIDHGCEMDKRKMMRMVAGVCWRLLPCKM